MMYNYVVLIQALPFDFRYMLRISLRIVYQSASLI